MSRAKRQSASRWPQGPEPLGALSGRVLIAAGTDLERRTLAASLRLDDACWVAAASIAEASALVAGCGLAIVSDALDDGRGLVLVRTLASEQPGVPVIVVSAVPTLEAAVDAMRSGASDLVSSAMHPDELMLRATEAVRRARLAHAKASDENHALRGTCLKLADTQRQMAQQVRSLCDDLTDACKDLATKARVNGIVGEFAGVVRQELDVEGLLRSAMEFILAKVGPTNAGVFLPSSSGDYSLGAYVNYDCPSETADVLLDQIACSFAPKMESHQGLLNLTSDEQLEAFLGDDAHWIAGSNLIAFACRNEDECLAIVVLFRDRYTPFMPATKDMLIPIAEVFGQQLGKVVHVHNRHQPKQERKAGGNNEQRGSNDLDAGDDDLDLAA